MLKVLYFLFHLYIFVHHGNIKNRAFRYCLLDAGHLIGSIEASAYLFDKSLKLFMIFLKRIFFFF